MQTNSQTAYYDGLMKHHYFRAEVLEKFLKVKCCRAENIKGVGSLLAFANTEGAFGYGCFENTKSEIRVREQVPQLGAILYLYL